VRARAAPTRVSTWLEQANGPATRRAAAAAAHAWAGQAWVGLGLE